MGISDKFKGLLDLILGTETDKDGDWTDGPLDENVEPNETVFNTDGPFALKPEPKFNRSQKESLKVVPMRTNHDVVVFEPRAYNEALQIVEAFKNRKTVILHLQLLDRAQSQKLVDFLCGCAYALEGNQRQIGDFVFVFTPSNIGLTSEAQTTNTSKFALDARWNQTQTL